MRAFAYRLLGRREYSVRELSNRISRKWPQASDIESFIDKLSDEDLVSDERFAEAFLRSRVQRHQGPMKIKAELRGKGVPDSIISGTLDSMRGQWRALAAKWLDRQHSGPIDFADKKKYYRRLVNRGFSHDQAMDALNRPGNS
ncbi:MAG: regulatory protein RecX [Thiogranum sp.]